MRFGDYELTEAEERVATLLPDVWEDAVHVKEIQDMTGYKPRDIKYLIMGLRKYLPICSDNNGYWIGNREELANMIKNFDAEISTKQRVRDNLNKLLREMQDD